MDTNNKSELFTDLSQEQSEIIQGGCHRYYRSYYYRPYYYYEPRGYYYYRPYSYRRCRRWYY
ncbi:MAG: hypothetical protein ACP5RH_02230 [Leptodesmis sp.]|uniref:hypothetical protein n=1 Tax=Leptodesmis sp. TaxID=3100501 RepID=UPI003D0D8B09